MSIDVETANSMRYATEDTEEHRVKSKEFLFLCVPLCPLWLNPRISFVSSRLRG